MSSGDGVIYLVAGLVSTAVMLGWLAGPVLDRFQRPAACPGIAIACWVAALTGAFIADIGVVAVALLAPPTPGHGLLEWLRDCLPHHGATWRSSSGRPPAWFC
ncbi:hypothetical protein [Actinomadura terrae]|uniref:hypothetical protein n=1 Tax=Actinomadura terrae TaxID=604353 RepID=UPI001FA6F03C|nr:hypothetical protein [Actinomadura terrae]